MARRRENMLEAFKASAERPPAQPQKGIAPQVAKGEPGRIPVPPRGTGGPGGVQVTGAGPAGSAHFESAGLTLPIGPGTFVLLQAVLLVAVFFMGRLSLGSSVLAGPDDGQSGADIHLQDPSGSTRLSGPRSDRGARSNGGERQPGTTPNGGGAQTSSNPADGAFLAAENKFTVLVCTYDDTEYGRDRAWEAFEHLQKEGFEAVTPRRQNGRLFLFVGASGSYKALEVLEKDLKRAEGPGGQRQPFRDAFRVNIEDYL